MKRRGTRPNCVLGLLAAVLLLGSAACGAHSPPLATSALASSPPPTHSPVPTPPPTPTSLPNPMQSPPPPASRTDGAAHVLRVIDGDTLEVEIDGRPYRVRYIGMDTPEQDMPFYQAATQANVALVADRDVRLETCISHPRRPTWTAARSPTGDSPSWAPVRTGLTAIVTASGARSRTMSCGRYG